MKLVDNPKLLDSHFRNGMMILPFYHCIIEARINKKSFAGEGIRKISIWKQLLSLFKGVRYCRLKRKDILIFSSTLFNVKKDKKYHNSLHGYYYDLFPNDTLLLEDGDLNYTWRTNKSCDALSFIHTYIIVLSNVLERIGHFIRPLYSEDYDVFINEYPQLFTKDILSKADYHTLFYSIMIRKLLKFVNPKVLFVNCASHGHHMAIVCYEAKKLGIKVIEPQHGVTYKCAGYQTSGIIAASKEYMNYLPDTLFTFGDYWKDFVDWKYEMVSVGYQFLNEYKTKIQDKDYTHDYLIISQPMNEKEEREKVNFVKSLSRAFPQKKILYRIHPSENLTYNVEQYKDFDNIEISNSTTVLYDDIMKCKDIIGWFSNCLYESLAFRKVPIIVDTLYTREYFPNSIGIWIKTPDELNAINIDELQNKTDYTQYWTPNFKERVKMYLDNII